jgi:hypothetical protein
MHKFFGVLRAVDTRQIKHEIAISTRFLQQGGSGVDVIEIQLVHRDGGMGFIFAVADVFERFGKVLSHKAARTGNQYLHIITSSYTL